MFITGERIVHMNAVDAKLLDTAAHQLRARGLAITVKAARHQDQVDAWIRVAKNKRHVDYAVEIKRQVTADTFGALVQQLKHWGEITKKPTLLVAAYIAPPVADRLMRANQHFMDAAGNAYLDTEGIFVLISGCKPERNTTRAKPGRAFTTAGLKILFAFICNPELAAAPYRTIAAAADVALGTLPGVLAGLQQIGYLHVMGKRRKLAATKRLLDEWALAYARTLRPKQLQRMLVAPTIATWRGWDLQADKARWGGEPAAALLTRYLEPGTLTLYAEKVPARLMVEHRMTTARPNDEHDLVEVRRPFWAASLCETVGMPTVPPALVYADLLAVGDARCIETAQQIHEKYLARFFAAN